MGAAKLLTAAGGAVTLDAASTATDKTITVPADNGTLVYANSSGNVGIGTSSPSAKLEIAGSSGNVQFSSVGNRLAFTRNGANYIGASGASGSLNYAAVTHSFYNESETTERMRIDSSGNLLVGATSVGGQGGFTVAPNTTAGAFQISVDRVSTTSNSAPVLFKNGGTQVGYIQYNNTSTTYGTSSDYRLKENILPMTGALEKIAALKPCIYTWKEWGTLGQGFIAHELQAVVPDCVTGEKDAVDADGNPVYQGIDTSFLVATLTAAIQELKAIVDKQATKIAALENQQ